MMVSEIIMRTLDKEKDTFEMLVPPRDQINSNTVITGNLCHFTYGALALMEHSIELSIRSSCMYITITVANSKWINPDSLTFNVIFVSNDGVAQNSTRHTFQQKPESHFCRCYKNSKYIYWLRCDWKFEEHPWNNNTHSIKFVFNVKPTLGEEGVEKNSYGPDMSKFLMNAFLSDFEIICENETLKAHRNVLASKSPKFDAMFNSDMKENRERRLIITSIKLEVLKELLRFMYTGKVDFKPDYLLDLFKAADEYLMTDLKEECITQITKEISLENALDIYSVAVVNECKPLHDVAVKFITLNNGLIADGPEKLIELLRRFPGLYKVYAA